MISPSKYVVSVGWSSVSPGEQVQSQHQVQGRLVLTGSAQTLDAEVAAEERFPQVNVFDLNLDLVDLPLGLLRPRKAAAGSEVC